MASVAVPGWELSSSSFSIALIPKGVAALPMPSILAVMLHDHRSHGGMVQRYIEEQPPGKGPQQSGKELNQMGFLCDFHQARPKSYQSHEADD